MVPIAQILPEVTNQNLELQKQESRLPKNGDEQGLIVALTSTKIKESSLEEIKQSLRYVMVKVGLRSQNWPNDEEKQILIAHIVQHFGNNTIDEIKLAFDLAITGKLELDKNEISCYENFSCLYFSQIMVAYRGWSSYAHGQIRREQEYHRMLEQSKPRELTNEEYQEWYDLTKQQVIDKIITIELIPELIYNWMDKSGRITLNTSDKKEYFNNASELHLRLLNAKCIENEYVPMKRRFYDTLLHNYKCQKEENTYSESTRQELIRLSKKMVLFDLMTKEVPGSNG